MISIDEFLKFNKTPETFDHHTYLELHPDTKDFYQPYCKDNNISDKDRLFFHFIIYQNSHNNVKFHYHTSLFEFISKLTDLANTSKNDELLDIIKERMYLLGHTMRHPVIINTISMRHKMLCFIKNMIEYFPEPKIEIIEEPPEISNKS